MPAVASIVITVDEKGAVTALNRIDAAGKQIDPGLQKIGQRGNVVLTGIETQSKKSAQAMQLLANITGVQMPRALEQVLSKAPGVSSALNAAFAATVVITLAKEVLNLVDNLTGYSAQLAIIQQQSTAIMDSVAQSNKTLLGPQTFAQINKQILDTAKGIDSLNQHFGLTGDAFSDALRRGITKYSASESLLLDQLDHEKELINQLYAEQAKLRDEQSRLNPVTILKSQNQAREAGLQGIAAIRVAEKDRVDEAIADAKANAENDAVTQAKIMAIHAASRAQRIAYEREVRDATADLVNQAKDASLTGLDLIQAHAQETFDKLSQDFVRNKIQFEDFVKRLHAIDVDTVAQTDKLTRSAAASGQQAILQAEAGTKTGIAQIEAQKLADLQQITQREIDLGVELAGERKALEIKTAGQIVQIRRQAAEQTVQAEEDAAVAIAAPWDRSNVQIRVDAERRIRSIQQALKDSTISEQQAAIQIQAVWQETFAKMRDSLADTLENLFNDVTSGNIGKTFLTMFKHMVFQMLATWILGLQGMRQATQQTMNTGGGGGILGSIFGGLGLGGIFGGGGGGSQGGISGIPGVITNFGGGGGGGESSSSSPLTVLPGIGLSAGAGSGTGGIGISLPSGSGSGGAFGSGPLGGILSTIFKGGGKFSPLLVTGGLALLGASFGKGGALGILGSAAGGALIGTAILPGIGTAIGAIAGALVGLFSSIFGEHKGDKARKQVMEPLKAQIKTIEDSYDVFQTDYNTGVADLETLRANAIDALKKIGGRQVKGNTKGTNELIDAAELHLKTTEAERARRSQIEFGPPQFRVGGYVSGSMASGYPAGFGASALHFATGGEVPAILHRGEFVMRPEAVSRIGVGPLERMNSGGSRDGDQHLHIHTLDAMSFEEFLSRGGGRKIAKFFSRAEHEGGF